MLRAFDAVRCMTCVAALVAMLSRCQRSLEPTTRAASSTTMNEVGGSQQESEADDGVWRRLEQRQRSLLLATGQRIVSIALSSSELLGALLAAVCLSTFF